MFRPIVVLRIAVLMLVTAAIACAPRTTPEKAGSPGVYESPDGIKFTVKVTPLRFAIGEPVSLEASMFNGGHDAFEKPFFNDCVWDYEVSTENGRVVTPPRGCVKAVAGVLRLEPGELRMILRDWKGNDDYFGAGAPLSPGRYSITAGFVDDHKRVVPMSEPVWIEIVASKKQR